MYTLSGRNAGQNECSDRVITMGMVVQHNMNALNAYNRLNTNVAGLKKASEKLSSGYRINRAGDDAAGLAISEKMRSQIRGLNQAKRNSQDGISMIQTFEGAAQETHSILQRMKELATESANGTYDNATDRAAIQLEFDQLNDELNQIADTDFNGTVVLNGGTMADGLEATGMQNGIGTFDYANKQAQVIAKAKDAAAADVTNAKAAMDKAAEAMTKDKFDLSANGTAQEWNTVDNSAYSKSVADTLWKALGLTADGTATAAADATKYSSADITFKVAKDATTGNLTYTVDSAKDNLGNDITAKAQAALTAITSFNGTATTTGKGGFTFTAGGATFNAEFDATTAKTGDTVTLTFTNTPDVNKAPTNITIESNSFKVTGGDKGNVTAPATTAVKLTNDVIKDSDMSLANEAIFKAIDGMKFEYTIGNGGKTVTGVKFTLGGSDTATDFTANIGTTKDISVSYTDENGATKTAKFNIKIANDGSIEFKTADPANADAGKTKFAEFGKLTVTNNATEDTKVEFELSLDAFKYAGETATPTISAGKDSTLKTSNSAADAYSAAQKAYADAVKAQADASADYASAKAFLDKKGVSVADSFDNSKAIMTYAENITLQTGARTKDSVNFTFNYDVKDTADLGTLEANLNISAREKGLNTEGLSLATAKDANQAIDQIDKAINKVSMVRASFGSIQNRLEHKIENLTTTSENLTDAESSIRDTDMASEMLNYTKYNILQQAAQSMLAQANQQPQSILQLLG